MFLIESEKITVFLILIFLGFPCIYSKAERNRIGNRKITEPYVSLPLVYVLFQFNPTPSLRNRCSTSSIFLRICSWFFNFMYFIEHCCICCVSYSSVTEDAGLEPWIVADCTLELFVYG